MCACGLEICNLRYGGVNMFMLLHFFSCNTYFFDKVLHMCSGGTLVLEKSDFTTYNTQNTCKICVQVCFSPNTYYT